MREPCSRLEEPSHARRRTMSLVPLSPPLEHRTLRHRGHEAPMTMDLQHSMPVMVPNPAADPHALAAWVVPCQHRCACEGASVFCRRIWDGARKHGSAAEAGAWLPHLQGACGAQTSKLQRQVADPAYTGTKNYCDPLRLGDLGVLAVDDPTSAVGLRHAP